MSVPEPPVPLENVCSVIYDNFLYVYSPTAFLRLELAPGAEWESLPKGESVTDGVCVGSTPQDSNLAGLYIVGGIGTNEEYRGLQKFTYSTGKWESITPSTAVTHRRRWHAATYLSASDRILVYAGNQDGREEASTQTFTIQASAPYEVLSYSSVAPPAISPLLMSWSESDAVLVGGSVNNRKVMLFNPDTAWRDAGSTMADPIPKGSIDIKGVLVDGDDGSKNLYTFDMTQSPNLVRRIVLVGAGGAPIVDSPTVIGRSEGGLAARQSEGENEQSALTVDNWPRYNDTLVPSDIRTRYAAASDADGLVVFSGGDAEEGHALCLFDTKENSWIPAVSKFSQQRVLTEDDSSVSGSSSSATSTRSISTSSSSPSSSSTIPAAAAGAGSSLSSNAILGIVLGSIAGIMVLLGLALFLIRRKKQRRDYLQARNLRRGSGAPGVEKGDMGFATDIANMTSPPGHFRGHQQNESAGSFSSMAILMGRVGQSSSKGLGRKPSNDTNRTSTSSIFNREFKNTISKPIPQMEQHPAMQSQAGAGDRTTTFGAILAAKSAPPPRPPRGSATLDQPGSSTRRSSGWNRYWSGGSALNVLGFGGSKRQTAGSDQSSRYSDAIRGTQDSATIPPLRIDGKPELNRVNSGSPTVAQYPTKIPIREGMSGKIERPVSTASSGYSSGIPASVHDTWDPLSVKKPWGADRAPSSAYSGSAQGHYQTTSLDPSSTSARPPTGVSTQPQLAMASTSDMSWLNLGDFNSNRS